MTLPFTVSAVKETGRWYQEQERRFPMRYGVTVHNLKTDECLMGAIVTFLSPEEYCEMHGLRLVERFKGTRPAFDHERTELV